MSLIFPHCAAYALYAQHLLNICSTFAQHLFCLLCLLCCLVLISHPQTQLNVDVLEQVASLHSEVKAITGSAISEVRVICDVCRRFFSRGVWSTGSLKGAVPTTQCFIFLSYGRRLAVLKEQKEQPGQSNILKLKWPDVRLETPSHLAQTIYRSFLSLQAIYYCYK